MNNVDISVIIPAYNCEDSIARCINSVICQTGVVSEVIVIDDGSTDNTLNICHSIAHNNPSVKIIHQNNGGLSSARNAGLDIATGKYISFLDSDDIITPTGLLDMLTSIKEYNVDAVIGKYNTVFEDNQDSHISPIPDDVIGKVYDFCLDEKVVLQTEINETNDIDRIIALNNRYFSLPDEIMATAWAVDYATKHPKRIKRMNKIITTAIKRYKAEN